MAERRYPLRETRARKALSSVSKNDRLSDLSDDLLHQIFSDIDLKDVIRTCILSKKWRYFWTTHAVLKFDSDSFTNSLKSIEFDDLVTQVLDRSCRNSNINTLMVLSFDHCSEINIRSWTQIAVDRHVQALHLLFCEPHFRALTFPPSLFTCQSLTKLELVLNISVTGIPVRLPLPNSIDLPHLKELSLNAVCTLSTQFLDKLFSGCPVLEMLVITNCTLDKSQSLVITSNLLKRLVIELYGDKYGVRKSDITVHAPNVIWFKIIDWCSNNYHLDNVASLETMYLENRIFWNATFPDANTAVKLLKVISSVRSLTVHHRVLQGVSPYLDILDMPPISFGTLNYLNVTIEIVEEHVQALKCILKNSPNIETLIIQNNTWQKNLAEIDGWEEGLSLQHLKCVELHSAQGFDYELGLLKGLMKSTMSLEKMSISTSTDLSAKDKKRLKFFTKDLMNFPHASTRVKISFRKSEQ